MDVTKPAGVAPYQRTEWRMLADMLCELFAERGIPHHRIEKVDRVPVATDAPDDDYGYTDRTTYFIDVAPAVANKMRAALKASGGAGKAPTAKLETERLRALYAAALDAK